MQETMVTVYCMVYNHEKYLRRCLEGFVNQKTNFKYDVIVHDDASTDRSQEIIKEYQEQNGDPQQYSGKAEKPVPGQFEVRHRDNLLEKTVYWNTAAVFAAAVFWFGHR